MSDGLRDKALDLGKKAFWGMLMLLWVIIILWLPETPVESVVPIKF